MMVRRVRSLARVRRGLSRTLGWSAALAIILPLVPASLGQALGVEWLWGAGAVGLLFGFSAAPLLAVLAPFVTWIQSRAPADVHVEQRDLVYTQGGRHRRVPRTEIEGGVLVPSKKGHQLELYLRGGDVIRVAVGDESSGNEILDELDLGPSERRVRVELAEPWRTTLLAGWRLFLTVLFWFMMLGWAVSTFETKGSPLPFVWFGPWIGCIIATFWAWQRLRRPPAVVVGSDGVRVERAMGSRSIPYDAIQKVWGHGLSLFIRETDGRLTSVSGGIAGPSRESSSVAPGLVLGMVERIERGQRTRGGSPETAAARLDRAGRSFADWVAGLRSVLSNDASYREAGLTPEDVASVLDDAALPAERRLGAAIALRGSKSPEARERIRIAAGLTTKEELRVALEQAAEAELDSEVLAEAAEAALRSKRV